LIESRIVVANNDFSRDLGIKFGMSRNSTFDNGDKFYSVQGAEGTGALGGSGLLVDLPVPSTSSIGLALGKVDGSFLLDLELSAMEAEGHGEVISNPRVLTSNQKAAYIETGTEIPYQEATSSGATSTSFKKAVLSLQVTPQITPDDRIFMDLIVNKDSVGSETDAGPAINTNEVGTQVLVDNGETLVLGGVYEQTNNKTVNRVPFFGELPLVDWMFKSTVRTNNKAELLIFVTPKIVKEDLRI